MKTADQYLPVSLVRSQLAKRFTLTDLDYSSGGPARYVKVGETGRAGFITPLTHVLRLQPCPPDLYRHALYVSWTG